MSAPSAQSGEAAAAALAAQVFSALGDPTRLGILTRLSAGDARSIAALSEDSRLTRQAVTKHLHVLEKAGLVASRRVGRESRFMLQPEPIDEAKAYLDSVCVQWDGALARLQAFLNA